MLDTIARPFGLLLMFLYNITHNYLFAIVLFTILIKLLLMPFQMKSKKGMMRQQLLQPEIQEIQKKHAGNQQKQSEEMQRVYREAGVSPMSGCLWSLLPLPIMLALYQAIRKPLTVMMGVPKALLEVSRNGEAVGDLAKRLVEVAQAHGLNFTASQLLQTQIGATKIINDYFSEFSGLSDKLRPMNFTVFGLDLSSVPNFRIWTFDFSSFKALWPMLGLFLIPIITAFFQWLSTKISTELQKNMPGANKEQLEKQSNSMMMLLLGPVMSLVFAFALPAAMGVYWMVNAIFSLLVDVFLTKLYEKTMLADFAEAEARRKAREAELEAKRAEAEKRRAESANLQTENTSKKKQQQKKKQEAAGRALEYQRAMNPDQGEKYNPSRVGNRPYARGRGYDPDRFSYNGIDGAVDDTSSIDGELSEEIVEKLEKAALPPQQENDAPDTPDTPDAPAQDDGGVESNKEKDL